MKNRQGMIRPMLVALLCLPAVLSAQVTVLTITDGTDSVARSGKVTLTPLGSFDPERLAVDRSLNPGDELSSRADGIVVVLRCGDNLTTASEVTLSAPFRVVLMPPIPDGGCAVSLQGGTVDIVAGSPTEIQSGEVTLGSQRTQFGMAVSRSGSRVNREAFVYEGRVSLKRPRQRTLRIGAGKKVAVTKSAEPRTMAIEKADIARAARLYARVDVSRSGLTGEQRKKSYRHLARMHSEVLKAPDKAKPKVDLALARMSFNVAAPSTIQYLAQAQKLTTPNSKALASATFIKGLAYQRLGDNTAATQAFTAARRMDPALNKDRIGQIYKVDPKVLQRIETPQLRPQAPGGLQVVQ